MTTLHRELVEAVDQLRPLDTLPAGVTPAHAVAQLEEIRRQHREVAERAKRYINRSGANTEAREGQLQVYDDRKARISHATTLIRQLRREAKV